MSKNDMRAMTPVAKDDPRLIAWEKYKQTDDYANSLRWVEFVRVEILTGELPIIKHDHLEGSLWALFIARFEAGQRGEKGDGV